MLRAEGLVVDLGSRFDEILKVGAREEVTEVNEFAVALVFDVDGAPAVLAAADGFAIDAEAIFTADYGEGDD